MKNEFTVEEFREKMGDITKISDFNLRYTTRLMFKMLGQTLSKVDTVRGMLNDHKLKEYDTFLGKLESLTIDLHNECMARGINLDEKWYHRFNCNTFKISFAINGFLLTIGVAMNMLGMVSIDESDILAMCVCILISWLGFWGIIIYERLTGK